MFKFVSSFLDVLLVKTLNTYLEWYIEERRSQMVLSKKKGGDPLTQVLIRKRREPEKPIFSHKIRPSDDCKEKGHQSF